MLRPEDIKLDLTRAWTEQLYREYEHICSYFRVSLATPVIAVEALTSVWGQWTRTTRRLTVSRRLIEQHAWDIVIEILKHEMAHQIADELLGGGGLPHGTAFQQGCDMLGVADWARAASGELPTEIPSWRDRALGTEEERLLKRAEKLLALAGSTNEHEAALAMERVRQLYAQYNLEAVKARRQSTHVYCVMSRKQKKISAEESMIFGVLTEHFFVRAIFLDQYDQRDLCTYKAVELLGTRENVLMAEYVYHFLRNQLDSLWATYRKDKSAPAKARRSYMIGVLSGFSSKLRKAAHCPTDASSHLSTTETKALIKLADQALDVFVGDRYPRLSTRRTSGVRGDRSTYDAGVRAGSDLNLHRGVTQRSGNKGLLIT
ncbi:MAG: DUF2786 domain-containing protein [Deltaproteobacteria bacterium]|nr:DUF2786 domain-containing protein [Deltaproteobacteria bacterium]